MDIRNLILNSDPPIKWSDDKNHPIHTLGCYYFGVDGGFVFDEEAVKEADKELLKKIYGEIARYWCERGICEDKYFVIPDIKD